MPGRSGELMRQLHCNSCKFWDSLDSESLPGWGHCSLLGEAGIDNEVPVWETVIRARAGGRDSGEGSFFTKQDFGCVEWQENV